MSFTRYRNIVYEQYLLAKKHVSFDYTDGLSLKERTVLMEVVSEDIEKNGVE